MGTALRSTFARGLRLAALGCAAWLPAAVALGGDCPQGKDAQAQAWWWEDAGAEAVAACFADEAAANPPVESGAAVATPLFLAARYSADPAVVRALLAAGARVRPPVAGVDYTVGDETALHVAARHNESAAVVAELARAGAAYLDRWDEGGHTPLHLAAAFNRNPSVAGVLLEAGAPVDAESNYERATPLHHAARSSRNPAVARLLLGAGADVDARARGVGPERGATPLHYAARYDVSGAVVEALVAAGADVTARNRNGAEPAEGAWARSRDVDAMLDATGETPLHHAARYNPNPAVVEALAAAGADVGATGGALLGTPLHHAAQDNANPAVVAALLEAGADVNARNRAVSGSWLIQSHMNGVTPLHRAAGGNANPAVAAALLRAGAEVDARDMQGATPLHFAAGRSWSPDVVRVLAAAGADVDAKVGVAMTDAELGEDYSPDDGSTALHVAVGRNAVPAVVAALVDAGAALDATDEEGRTPRRVAEEAGRGSLAAMLGAAEVERGLALGGEERRLIRKGLEAAGYAPGLTDGFVSYTQLDGRLKFKPGVAHGMTGGGTRGAIRRWQGARGAPVTGYLDEDAARALAASGREREERRRAEVEASKFRDCPQCPEMVVVPAGSYRMGSPPGKIPDLLLQEDEGPVHRVTIGYPFAVGVYEVTRGEYGRFVSETGYSGGGSCYAFEEDKWEKHKWKERSSMNWKTPGFSQTDGHPVTCVSWEDAKAYVDWLSGKTGEAYRLLSESEWEYVARGGTRTERYWGERPKGQCRYANGADESTDVLWRTGCNDGHARTSPVGSFQANGFGLHDVLGNVWEWVEDCWNESYRGAPGDGSAWGSGDCGDGVLRGGSWANIASDLRSAVRNSFASGHRHGYAGLRVARTLPPSHTPSGAGGGD